MKWWLLHIGFFILICNTSAQNPDSARSAFEYGDYEQVSSILRPIIKKQPRNFDAHSLYAQNLLALGEIDAALDYLDSLIATHDGVSSLFHWKGEALLKKLNQIDGFFESGRTLLKARDALFKAIQLDENNLEARLTLAGYYFEAPGIIGGSKLKANKEIEYVRQKSPIKASLFMADYHIQKKRYAEAEEELTQLVDTNRVNGEVYHALGRLYQQTKEHQKAFDSFLAGIQLNHHGSYYQYARTAVFSQSNVQLGINYLQVYLKRRPKKEFPALSYAHWRLGLLYELQGENEKALEEYKTSLRLNPEVVLVKESLESLQQKLNKN